MEWAERIAWMLLAGGLSFWVAMTLWKAYASKRLLKARLHELDGLRKELNFKTNLLEGRTMDANERMGDVDRLIADLQPGVVADTNKPET